MATIPLAVMTVPPVLYYSGVWPHGVTYLIPTQGPLLLFGEAFHQVSLAPWQVIYAVAYPSLCVVGLWWAARVMFVRFVVARSGGM
jgi:fluoroquinolone transport system permease protein